jgi:hypothetical protein
MLLHLNARQVQFKVCQTAFFSHAQDQQAHQWDKSSRGYQEAPLPD